MPFKARLIFIEEGTKVKEAKLKNLLFYRLTGCISPDLHVETLVLGDGGFGRCRPGGGALQVESVPLKIP